MSFSVSSPGRICLFGEHQDYLGLPVVAAAINLRMEMRASFNNSDLFRISMPDIGEELTLSNTGEPLDYVSQRDYYRSVYNVLLSEGVSWKRGLDVEVRSRIPINAGTSSSAAMVLCWTQLLLIAGEDARAGDRHFVARTAHRAEVMEFNEPCGMMDQFSCGLGHIIHLNTQSGAVETLNPALGSFVLGDSGQPKDTVGLISQLKSTAQESVSFMKAKMPQFNLHQTPYVQAEPFFSFLPQRHREVLEANLRDRDLLREALPILRDSEPDHQALGNLLLEHHAQLSQKKRTSTAKIDRMIDAAVKAGAYGGKINGSGGGGCMFAYAPGNGEKVAEALRECGGKAWVLGIDGGVRKD